MSRRLLSVVLSVTLSIFITACGALKGETHRHKGEVVEGSSSRFVYAGDFSIYDKFMIIRDTETGVLYIMYEMGPTFGLSPLYDSDGNIVVED